MIEAEYDTIIIGAGSAGATLAARLNEDPAHRVLLLEAGRDMRSADTPEHIQIPNPIRAIGDDDFRWPQLMARRTEQQDRRLRWRSRAMGGSSTINGQVYQAWSQGHVRITTSDPTVDPAVEERMLSDERDLVRMRDGVRRLREICRAEGVTKIAHRAEYGLTGRSMEETLSEAELHEWLFAECGDAQHASGTCRMGAADDPRSVVDPECRVLGCTGLRVIEVSIMPEVPRANTHLTTVAIAERMAERIRLAA